MKTKSLRITFAVLCLARLAAPVQADTFGNGANAFIIDFVEIGNAGNPNDTVANIVTPGVYFGGVAYRYRIAVTEVPQNWITKATNRGLANAAAGGGAGGVGALKPATLMTWYESAAFVNWLNTSNGHHAAYDLTWTGSEWTMNLWSNADAWQLGGENLYRHKDAYYFLPSENEWYKAAYHKNDGVTANYWRYPTGSDTAPTPVASGTAAETAVYSISGGPTANVDDNGGLSPYGTQGQGGNVWEWQESASTAPNDSPSKDRTARGGEYSATSVYLRSNFRNSKPPTLSLISYGFRVASAALLDTDGDGIPDQFETGTGIYVSPANTGTSPTNADSDGDGFKDGFEVSTGFNPNSAASTPETLSTLVIVGGSVVEYRFNAANGVSYRIESSPDLVNWSTVEPNITGTGGAILRTYSIVGQLQRFFIPRRN